MWSILPSAEQSCDHHVIPPSSLMQSYPSYHTVCIMFHYLYVTHDNMKHWSGRSCSNFTRDQPVLDGGEIFSQKALVQEGLPCLYSWGLLSLIKLLLAVGGGGKKGIKKKIDQQKLSHLLQFQCMFCQQSLRPQVSLVHNGTYLLQ